MNQTLADQALDLAVTRSRVAAHGGPCPHGGCPDCDPSQAEIDQAARDLQGYQAGQLVSGRDVWLGTETTGYIVGVLHYDRQFTFTRTPDDDSAPIRRYEVVDEAGHTRIIEGLGVTVVEESRNARALRTPLQQLVDRLIVMEAGARQHRTPEVDEQLKEARKDITLKAKSGLAVGEERRVQLPSGISILVRATANGFYVETRRRPQEEVLLGQSGTHTHEVIALQRFHTVLRIALGY